MPSQLALRGGTIYTPYEEIQQGIVLCEDGYIKAVFPEEKRQEGVPDGINLSGMIICPGFIDIHLHGAAGIDFLDAQGEDLSHILHLHALQGTTTLLPTLMSAPVERMIKAVERIVQWKKKKDQRGIIHGLHLEGPFLNPCQTGIHDKHYLFPPSKEILLKLIRTAQGLIKILTLAPELEGAYELINIAREHDIIVSAGHSIANYQEMNDAIEKGVSHVSHFFNAMGHFHHREPGIIGAVLTSSSVTAELIMDSIHSHPASAQILIRMLGNDRVILVTDSSPLLGLEDGVYGEEKQGASERWVTMDKELKDLKGAGIRVYSKGSIKNGLGQLAGSALTLPMAVKNCVEYDLASLPQAIAMATVNPARLLRLEDETGQIKPGYRADIVALDREFRPRLIIKRGTILYNNII